MITGVESDTMARLLVERVATQQDTTRLISHAHGRQLQCGGWTERWALTKILDTKAGSTTTTLQQHHDEPPPSTDGAESRRQDSPEDSAVSYVYAIYCGSVFFVSVGTC